MRVRDCFLLTRECSLHVLFVLRSVKAGERRDIREVYDFYGTRDGIRCIKVMPKDIHNYLPTNNVPHSKVSPFTRRRLHTE